MRGRNVAAVIAVAIAGVVVVFAPALLSGKVLAVGDGLIEALPAFFAPMHLWNADLFIGYPLYADSSQAAFYPLRLLRFVPGGFDLYIMASFTIAAAALFGYLVDVVDDRVAAAAGAVSFTLGGSMLSHFGHPMIDHPAAWSIVALWTFSRYHKTRQMGWLGGSALAIAVALSAGQPQIVLFAIVVLSVHALVLQGPEAIARRSVKPFVAGVFALVLGVGLGAVCVLPAIELGEHSSRAVLSFPAFAQDSIPLEHLALRLAFPYAIGGGSASIFSGMLLDAPSGSATETTVFVPVAAVALAVAGIFGRPRRLALFWTAVAVGGIALSAGSELPLALWTYTLAPFNAFRLPGRHAFEITLSLSVLAAFGIAALRDHVQRKPLIVGIVSGLAVVGLAMYDVVVADPRVSTQPVVVWFAIAAAGETSGLVIAARMQAQLARRVAAGCVVVGAFMFAILGYSHDAPPANMLAVPPYVQTLRHLPIGQGQRIYSYSPDEQSPLRPNVPMIWNVPEVAGYTPLQYPRLQRFLHVAGNGQLLDIAADAIDLASIRYVVVPAQSAVALPATAPFDAPDLGMFESGAASDAASSLSFGLPAMVTADRIVMVSALGDSVAVPQNTIIGSLIVRFVAGGEQTLALRAGVDTAELAYDRADIAGHVRHREPSIFSRDASTTWFTTSRPLHRGRVRSVTLRIAASTHAFNIRKLSLIDSARSRAYPFNQESVLYADTRRFRHVIDSGGVAIFENRRARSRVWVEGGAGLPARGLVELSTLLPERREMHVQCAERCTLVSSDENNADWFAMVDGTAATLGQVHGVLEAVTLSAGRHNVVVAYRPKALIAGGAMSLGAAGCIALWMLLARIRSHRLRNAVSTT